MTATNINISIDSELGTQAQNVLASLGLDMTEAINIFLQQTIRQRSMPFVVPNESAKRVPQPGCMKGKIWMSDDFDAPMELRESAEPEKKPYNSVA